MPETTTALFRLDFTTKVLGEKAASRLQEQKVSQTIRSQSGDGRITKKS